MMTISIFFFSQNYSLSGTLFSGSPLTFDAAHLFAVGDWLCVADYLLLVAGCWLFSHGHIEAKFA